VEVLGLRKINTGVTRFFFENAGSFLIADGRIVTLEEFENSIYNDGIWGGKIIYEVVRIIGGTPLFIEDHYKRLQDSLGGDGMRIAPGLDKLRVETSELILKHGLSDCNIKLWFTLRDGGTSYVMNINKSFYPPSEYYKKGVAAALLEHTRANPNKKLVVDGYKEKINDIKRDKNVFEVLLIDRENNITEGSKTNLFFAVGDRLYTAPPDAVLKGITRKYVFEAAKIAGIEIVEAKIKADKLDNVDGLFISGTSVSVLPVSLVENKMFDSPGNKLISIISEEYNKIASRYLAEQINKQANN
jgi:branched-chain amino acid aminotransferase